MPDKKKKDARCEYSEEFMKEIGELITELVTTYEKYPVTFEKERKYSYGKKKKK